MDQLSAARAQTQRSFSNQGRYERKSTMFLLSMVANLMSVALGMIKRILSEEEETYNTETRVHEEMPLGNANSERGIFVVNSALEAEW